MRPGDRVVIEGVAAEVVNTGPRLTVVRCQGRTLTVPTATVEAAPALVWPPVFCPLCGSDAVESHVGVITTPGLTGQGADVRLKALGRFTVCMRCDWAVEDAEVLTAGTGPAV